MALSFGVMVRLSLWDILYNEYMLIYPGTGILVAVQLTSRIVVLFEKSWV